MILRSASLILLALAAECAPRTIVQTYSLSVRNETTTPLTIALTKDGPPYEAAWASPEDIVAGHVEMKRDQLNSYATITAGQSQGVKSITGEFAANTHALLRVYRGSNLQLRDMLAIKPGPDRQDVALKPGDNRFIIHDTGGKLSIDSAAH